VPCDAVLRLRLTRFQGLRSVAGNPVPTWLGAVASLFEVAHWGILVDIRSTRRLARSSSIPRAPKEDPGPRPGVSRDGCGEFRVWADDTT
jgi:hypothetical protein